MWFFSASQQTNGKKDETSKGEDKKEITTAFKISCFESNANR